MNALVSDLPLADPVAHPPAGGRGDGRRRLAPEPGAGNDAVTRQPCSWGLPAERASRGRSTARTPPAPASDVVAAARGGRAGQWPRRVMGRVERRGSARSTGAGGESRAATEDRLWPAKHQATLYNLRHATKGAPNDQGRSRRAGSRRHWRAFVDIRRRRLRHI